MSHANESYGLPRASKPYKAVILAGGVGNRMFPLTIGQPKALLPIANRPMLYYQLNMLENCGFTDIVIITKTDYFKAISEYIETQTVVDAKSVKVVVSDAAGTADVLRDCASEIGNDSDFYVISGDLITTATLEAMSGAHRLRGATITSMFKLNSATTVVPSTDPKNQEEDMSAQIVGLDESTGRLVYVRMRYAVQSLSMNKQLLCRFPNVSFKSDLQHAHVYLMSPTIFKLLEEQAHISSIQADLVPYLVTAQAIPEAQEWAPAPLSPKTDRVSCYAYLAPDNVFLERANNISMYTALNFRVASDALPMAWSTISAAAGCALAKETCRTAALNDCLVGNDLKLEPCTLNRVVVGHHCRLGKGVRVSNSVIMDYVVLEPGAQVSDSIVCASGVISAKAVLKQCRVASGCVVPAGAMLEKESLQAGDAFDDDDEDDEDM